MIVSTPLCMIQYTLLLWKCVTKIVRLCNCEIIRKLRYKSFGLLRYDRKKLLEVLLSAKPNTELCHSLFEINGKYGFKGTLFDVLVIYNI